MGKELNIVKVPRSDPILDKAINFVPLQNLHLDLMEVKKKIKKGLPAIVIKKQNIPPAVVPTSIPISTPQPKSDEENTEDIPDEMEIEMVEGEADAETNDGDEAEMLDELGENDSSPSNDSTQKNTKSDTQEAPQENQSGEPDPYEGMSPEEIEAHEKQEYVWRFKILKKQYKTRDIPSFNEHDDLPHMKSTYDQTIKEIHLENNVDSYRTYLVGGFMCIEFAFINFLGIDMKGFTAAQMAMMDKYDIMLIELGERSYNRWGTNFPIEIRLLGFILLQAGLFYLGKMITDKVGINLGTLFNGVTGQAIPTQGTSPSNAPVKKMRGPSIKISDIKRDEKDEE